MSGWLCLIVCLVFISCFSILFGIWKLRLFCILVVMMFVNEWDVDVMG